MMEPEEKKPDDTATVEPDDKSPVRRPRPAIRLIGVGGAGGNAVSRLLNKVSADIECSAINCDGQALSRCPLERKLLIGEQVVRGLGAGSDPEVGQRVAEASVSDLTKWVTGADVVVLVAGLGGGTGGPVAGAAAKAATAAGALTLAFPVLPFSFEGVRRRKQADASLAALRQHCDAAIPLPNDLLLQQMGEETPAAEVLRRSDEWVGLAIQSLRDVLCSPGEINLDLGNLRRVFRHRGGKTLFGFGRGGGERASDSAFSDFLLCPLLHSPEFASRAENLLINVSAGPDFSMSAFHDLVKRVTERFGRDGHIAMGLAIEERLRGSVEIFVLGTTDIGRPGAATRRPAAKPEPAPVPPKPSQTLIPAQSKPNQEEFGFETQDHRGFFNRSEANRFEGEDLDIPTYLRRGIKISL
jgi:cell division protein FtsZ